MMIKDLSGKLSMGLLDPHSTNVIRWNKTFLLCSMVAVSLDPLFLYIPGVDGIRKCIDLDRNLTIVMCVIRSFGDILYFFHIIIKFRTRREPSNNHTEKREFIDKPLDVAKRYLTSDFILDVSAAFPLPQIAVLEIIPQLEGRTTKFSMRKVLRYFIVYQYFARVIQTSLLYRKVTTIFGFLIEEPWVRAAHNLLLYVIASQVIGSVWYFFALESEIRCWNIACKTHNCNVKYFYCGENRVGNYGFLNTSCPPLERSEIRNSTNFDFGIYLDAIIGRVLETTEFNKKILMCSLWGLQNLSSLGQGLRASTLSGDILFSYFISIIGLVLFALLIGNMQKYLQSPSNLTLRMKEKKENRTETEDIMSHFSFPEGLRQKIRRHKDNKWQLTRGVDLDSFVGDFPQDLKMEIKRHISLPSLDKVPIFKEMDKHLLDAMCDRLKPVQYTSDSCLVREGDPVREILFITDGKVESETTDVGIRTGAGGFMCGKELFLWAFDPKRSQLPFSTTTVKAVTDVQAFALGPDDLLFLASQFDIGFQYTFRFYIYSPHNWRTLAAACRIQAAYRKRKQENTHNETSTLSLGASIYVSRFSTNALRNLRRNHYNVDHVSTPTLELMRQNPTQPMTQQSLHSDDGPHLQIKTE